MKNNKIKIKRAFKIFDYHISHNLLLFKQQFIAQKDKSNIFILFEGVFFMHIPNIIGLGEIYIASDLEINDFNLKFQVDYTQELSIGLKLFIIKSNGKCYYIGAGRVQKYESENFENQWSSFINYPDNENYPKLIEYLD